MMDFYKEVIITLATKNVLKESDGLNGKGGSSHIYLYETNIRMLLW